MLQYGRQSIDDSDIDAVCAALRGDRLTTGPEVDGFEADLAAVTGGVPCVAVTSGTAALHAAYAAAVSPGDEVVCPPLTFAATAATAMAQGARIVFADVEDDTGNLAPNAADAALTSRTRVVTAVDYAGHPAEYDEIRKVANRIGALVIADAAHSIGSSYHGRPVGSLADLTAFSFFPTKNFTTAEGGAVAVAHAPLADRVRTFRSQGMVRDRSALRYPDEGGWHQEVHALGLNYRLPDVLCALGRSQLRRLAHFKTRRAQIVNRYNELLADVPGLRLPTTRDGMDPIRHLYPVRILDGRRREVYERMQAAGIGVQVNYIPVYWHPVFEDLGYKRGLCPVAEQFYREELSLPLYADLTIDQQDHVIETLRKIVES